MSVHIQIPPVPGVSVAAAAFAARLSTSALRHWLNDRDFAPLVRGPARAWHRFQPADIVRAAIAGRLVAHGFTVGEAVAVVVEQVDPHIEAVVEICGNIPWPMLRGRLLGVTANASRSPHACLSLDIGAVVVDVEERFRARLVPAGGTGSSRAGSSGSGSHPRGANDGKCPRFSNGA